MPDPNDSPAVQSYNAERARTRTAKDPLEQGLEDSFPASDPVSAVHTSAANVRDDGANSSEDEYPLVDEALRSTRHSSFGDGSERVQALRRDAARITGQASEVASGTADLARDEWRLLRPRRRWKNSRAAADRGRDRGGSRLHLGRNSMNSGPERAL